MSKPAAAVDSTTGRTYALSLPPEWLAQHPPSAAVRMTGTTAMLPSVTSILSGSDKPGLPWGAAGETSSWVIQNLDTVQELVASAAAAPEEGTNPCKACGRMTIRHLHDKGWWLHEQCQEPWKVIRKQFQLRWNEKRDRGTSTHDFVEQSILGVAIDPADFGDAEGNARSWLRFVEKYDPRFIMSEATVFNLRYGYAGTLDSIMEVGGQRWLVDVKSGPKVYFEHHLQLAAYRYAEGVYVSAGVVEPMPDVDAAGVLLLGEDRYKFEEVTAGPDAFERGFASLLTLFRYKEAHGE